MKRIAAIVLPDVACELARERKLVDGRRPFAVIVDDTVEGELDTKAILDAVDAHAGRYGVRPGQSAAQACAYVSGLRIARLSKKEVLSALGGVAEIALAFGTTAALTLERGDLLGARYPMGAGAGPFDTVWLDVSGCSRLVGGEDVLCAELIEKVRELGHRARVAIAGGPRLARALARWKVGSDLIVPSAPAQAARELGELPIAALPLERETLSWFGKLGILRIDDLARLDRKRLAHRLDDRDILALIEGRDDVPLCPYQAPRCIVESSELDAAIDGREPLLFVLRGLSARAVARLDARGEACGRVTLTLAHDRGVVALENRNERLALGDETRFELVPPIVLSRQEELMRTLTAKLERLDLPAPIVAVTLMLDELTTRSHTQFSIGHKQTADPDALPTLLVELGAWLGTERVGVLQLQESHRPEARSHLVAPALPLAEKKTTPVNRIALPEPTRLLPRPITIGAIERGALVTSAHEAFGTDLFIVEGLRSSARIDRVEWWTTSPVCRDYARAWLRSGLDELAEAWMFVDRSTGQSFLHGWFD
ncbi:MAG TPA: DNA polymerase Y family protein [Polyangiaceae bacterium]|nr:DNA polymerase Y family protein [Polyangiaceae bacterium]